MKEWRRELKEILAKKRAVAGSSSEGINKHLRRKRMDFFFEQTVLPAFKDLKKEIEKNNGDVTVTLEKETYQASIIITRNQDTEFYYTIRECRHHGKYFAFPQIVKPGEPKALMAQVIMPHKKMPARDIHAFTPEAIIEDFLSAYARYI